MVNKVTIDLGRNDTYRNLFALCNQDGLFGIRRAEIDNDLEALTVCDLQLAQQQGGRAKGAIVGTVRLLPARDKTMILFVGKDALWHLPIFSDGTVLFQKFIQRVITHFQELNLLVQIVENIDAKSVPESSNLVADQMTISESNVIVILGGSKEVNIFLDNSQQINQSGGISLNSEGNTNIGGDVSGRDKINNTL